MCPVTPTAPFSCPQPGIATVRVLTTLERAASTGLLRSTRATRTTRGTSTSIPAITARTATTAASVDLFAPFSRRICPPKLANAKKTETSIQPEDCENLRAASCRAQKEQFPVLWNGEHRWGDKTYRLPQHGFALGRDYINRLDAGKSCEFVYRISAI